MEYIKPGTIGYIKDKELKIRQARCIDYVIDGSPETVKWQIAGCDETICTDLYGDINSCSVVFKSAIGAYDGKGDGIDCNAEFDMKKLALEFYPNAKLDGSNYGYLLAKCCKVLKDMTISCDEKVRFQFHISKNGVIPKLPSVDNKECFLTYEDAAASRPAPEIITFDDDQQHEECEQDPVLRAIVEMPQSVFDSLDKCRVVKICEE